MSECVECSAEIDGEPLYSEEGPLCADHVTACPSCGGYGEVEGPFESGPYGEPIPTVVTCPTCYGAGAVPTEFL
ncbi:hypothetical protein [Haloarcula sediminis]|uniref:hypothetical protein n=1 Tax=Haloarcula sediminis TaxID=3111777 RepID=UPI002D77F3FC|nr:hypothetical protein [Haloarcula sp. CK38]